MLNSFDPEMLTSRSKSEYLKIIDIPKDYNDELKDFYPNANSDIPVRLEVWDTAGQEAFNSINATYFRQADAALFIYDVGRKETLDQVVYWANELDQMEGKATRTG